MTSFESDNNNDEINFGNGTDSFENNSNKFNFEDNGNNTNIDYSKGFSFKKPPAIEYKPQSFSF